DPPSGRLPTIVPVPLPLTLPLTPLPPAPVVRLSMGAPAPPVARGVGRESWLSDPHATRTVAAAKRTEPRRARFRPSLVIDATMSACRCKVFPIDLSKRIALKQARCPAITNG